MFFSGCARLNLASHKQVKSKPDMDKDGQVNSVNLYPPPLPPRSGSGLLKVYLKDLFPCW